MKEAGRVLLVIVFVAAVAAPWISPNSPDDRFPDLLYAPPTVPHWSGGHLEVYPPYLVNRLERRFAEDRQHPMRVAWFSNGRLVTADGPLLLLGADAYGRDILSRLLYGARITLALAVLATIVAMLIGGIVGGIAGYAGGWIDEVLSRGSDFVLVLPVTYVVLALRAVMPLVLPAPAVFALLAAIFALVGWPAVARGVRGIVASEREREYVLAGRALGAGPWRVLSRHVLPAASGHLLTQGTLLLPAFIVAEATISYVGLGFPDSVPTWGTMLQDASTGTIIAEAPWMLAPALAIFLVVLGVNLAVQGSHRALIVSGGDGQP
jgi:peptide/nickel transport system permease protein